MGLIAELEFRSFIKIVGNTTEMRAVGSRLMFWASVVSSKIIDPIQVDIKINAENYSF